MVDAQTFWRLIIIINIHNNTVRKLILITTTIIHMDIYHAECENYS